MRKAVVYIKGRTSPDMIENVTDSRWFINRKGKASTVHFETTDGEHVYNLNNLIGFKVIKE